MPYGQFGSAVSVLTDNQGGGAEAAVPETLQKFAPVDFGFGEGDADAERMTRGPSASWMPMATSTAQLRSVPPTRAFS